MLLTHADLFTPVDLKRRIFRKVAGRGRRATACVARRDRRATDGRAAAGTSELRERAFETGPVAQIVVDVDGMLALANERARALFGLAAARPRPAAAGPRALLPAGRAALVHRRRPRRAAGRCRSSDVEWQRPTASPSARRRDRRRCSTAPAGSLGRQHHLHRRHPLPAAARRARALQARARDRLRGAAVDQRGAGDHQRGAPVHQRGARDHQRGAPVDQRGARDDERGAPVDQRGAADHQRRAARSAATSSTEVNAFLESILAQPRVAVVVLDRELRVQIWNDAGRGPVGAARRRGRRASTCSTSTSGCRWRSCAGRSATPWPGNTEGNEVVLDATNRRGRAIGCKVTCLPLIVSSKDVHGVIVLMEQQRKAS